MSVRAWIGLGANQGRRRATLEAALAALADTDGVELEAVSPLVETEPEGGPAGQRRYRNGVARIATTLSADGLFERLRALESEAGRDRRREVRNGPRTLDLDLLLFGDERRAGPSLELPHPRLEERTFVLAPLAAIDPALVLPGCGRSVAARLAELEAAPTPAR